MQTCLSRPERRQFLAFTEHPSRLIMQLKGEGISPLSCSYSSFHPVRLYKRPEYYDSTSSQRLEVHNEIDDKNLHKHNQSPFNVAASVATSRSCRSSCRCSCHYRISGRIGLGGGSLGYLFFNHTGNAFRPRRCTLNSCAGGSLARFSMVYYGSRWVSNASLALCLTNSGRINISLSFPRILPPDHEFFQAIRQGDCERMRELLVTGRASPADIALPHGLTALDLAMFYDQWEASQLLISEGATQFVSPHNHWVVKDVWEYFANCNLIRTSITAFTVTYDGVCMTAPGWHIGTLRTYTNEARLDALNFSRVHKSVVGLSSEGLENIGNLRERVNEIDSFGRTPLYWAATLGLLDVVEKLLFSGASPNLADFNGSTPLHRAASIGSVSAIKLLCSAGASLEARDRQGYSPLFYACAQGQINAIKALLRHGADMESATYVGETSIYFANHAMQPAVVQFLTEQGASLQHADSWGFTPVLDAVFEDSHDALRYLLTQHWDKNARLFDSKNILHIAALNSNLETIEILLGANVSGINPYALDDAGFTPLEYLLRRSNAQDLLEPFCALLLRADSNGPGYNDEIFHSEDEFYDAFEYFRTGESSPSSTS